MNRSIPCALVIAALTLGATSGTVNPWYYPPLQNLCRAGSLPDYMRDVDFSPDGSWFAFVSTGLMASL